MPDKFAFRVTKTTKDWLYNLDILYDDITDIRVEMLTGVYIYRQAAMSRVL